MKRTKEAYFRPNPNVQQTQESSGLTFLIGEDHSYYDRDRHYKELQREYLNEQMQEKQRIKENEKKTNEMFDQQLLRNTHQRGQLEMEKHHRLHEV